MLHRFFSKVFPAALTVVIVFIGSLQAQDAPYIFLQTGHTDAIHCIDQSPDERDIVTASADKTLKLWDFQTGKEIRTFEGHTNRVKAVMFSPDGKMIVSGSLDGTVRLWDINNGKEIRKLTCDIYQIEKIFITSDGRYILASGDFERYIQKWDLNTGEPVKTLSDTVYTGPVAFSSDGKYALAKDFKYDLRVWDTDQGKVIKKLKGHKNQLTHFDISGDGKYAVSADLDGTIIIWDAIRWKERATIKSEPLHDLVISADGKKMLRKMRTGNLFHYQKAGNTKSRMNTWP